MSIAVVVITTKLRLFIAVLLLLLLLQLFLLFCLVVVVVISANRLSMAATDQSLWKPYRANVLGGGEGGEIKVSDLMHVQI